MLVFSTHVSNVTTKQNIRIVSAFRKKKFMEEYSTNVKSVITKQQIRVISALI